MYETPIRIIAAIESISERRNLLSLIFRKKYFDMLAVWNVIIIIPLDANTARYEQWVTKVSNDEFLPGIRIKMLVR